MKSCDDCGYHKTYINRRKMEDLKTDTVIWYEYCENVNVLSEIEDLTIADKCSYYDDVTWVK